jgi:FeS assembly protein IscX
MVTWEDTFAIVELLKKKHPLIELSSVSLKTIFRWVIDLPEFEDDLELANDEILESIFQEWYEEANPV